MIFVVVTLFFQRSYIVQMIKILLKDFMWNVFSHPAYLLDLKPSDSHLLSQRQGISYSSRWTLVLGSSVILLASEFSTFLNNTILDLDTNSTCISDFGRKIFSELIMAAEYIYVSIEINLSKPIDFTWNYSFRKEKTVPFLPPPNFPPSSQQQFFHLDTSCSGSDIINMILSKFHYISALPRKTATKLRIIWKKIPQIFGKMWGKTTEERLFGRCGVRRSIWKMLVQPLQLQKPTSGTVVWP